MPVTATPQAKRLLLLHAGGSAAVGDESALLDFLQWSRRHKLARRANGDWRTSAAAGAATRAAAEATKQRGKVRPAGTAGAATEAAQQVGKVGPLRSAQTNYQRRTSSDNSHLLHHRGARTTIQKSGNQFHKTRMLEPRTLR